MPDVNKIIDNIIRREGGYINHPNDRQGATKFGITQKTLSRWYKKKGIKDEATVDDVKNLDRETAVEIYKEEYYYDPKIDQLPESIQEFVLDTAVHSGPNKAIKFVQRACKNNGFPPGILDGIVGSKTIAAAKKFDRYFLDELINIREDFFYRIVEADTSQGVFLSGWIARLEEWKE